MSDSLLLHEQATLALVEGVFVDAVPAARRITSRASVRGLDISLRSRAEMTSLVTLATETLASTRPLFAALAETSLKIAGDSIAGELAVCEEALAAKYDGCAVAAMTRVADTQSDLLSAAIDQYAAIFDATLLWFQIDATREWTAASLYLEDAAALDERMFSTTTVRRPGHSGRGLWWKPYTWLSREVRECQIRAVNRCREGAMQAFNDVADER